jgi:ABC-type multidrug transport system ATPase subunit
MLRAAIFSTALLLGVSGASALDPSSTWEALTSTGEEILGLGDRFVKMEKQLKIRDRFSDLRPGGWTRTGKALDGDWHEMTFAVKQNNIEHLKDRIEQTSDLDSPLYGQHLSFEEVGNLVRNKEGTSAVKKWLEANGVVASSTEFGEYIYAGASVGVWRGLLSTKFHRYEAKFPGGKDGFVIRAPEYSLPGRISKHVDYVLKATHLPTPTAKISPIRVDKADGRSAAVKKRAEKEEQLRRRLLVVPPTAAPTLVPSSMPTLIPTPTPTPDLCIDICDDLEDYFELYYGSQGLDESIFGRRSCKCTSPSLLNDIYNITDNSAPNGTFGVYESLGQYGNAEDLANFQSQFNLPEKTYDNVVGGHYGTARTGGGEANLDIQYLNAIASGKSEHLWFWYAQNHSEWGVLMSDWLVSVADAADYPLIFSVSYGWYESDSSEKPLFETEAIKLAAKGVTIVVSSGDDGTPGNLFRYLSNSSSKEVRKYCREDGYSPMWPASSPYVVAVGATSGPEYGKDEYACSSQTGGVITSGGGFSDFFSVPAYQEKYVNQYFKTPSGKAAKSGYARYGRGYPDVAMLGSSYIIGIDDGFTLEWGTSASAPVFAGALALLNSRRIANGLTSIGWATPQLYKMYGKWGKNIFNDVTSGENHCTATFFPGEPDMYTCCEQGFNASEGWDPVTGLGSVNVGALLFRMSDYTFSEDDDDYTNTFSDDDTVYQAPTSERVVVLIFFLLIMGACTLCAYTMSGRLDGCCGAGGCCGCCECCKPCLIKSVGCKALEDCCKSKKGSVQRNDWFDGYFGWMSPICAAEGSVLYTLQFQTGLLMWKRITENLRNTYGTAAYFAAPLVVMLAIKILIFAENNFETGKSSGAVEVFFAPFLYIFVVQLTTVSLVEEKSSKLRESMRMMGMLEAPYWASYILVDAILQGFLLSFVMAVWASVLGLFYNVGSGHGDKGDGSFGELLLLFYFTAISVTTAGFAMSSVFNDQQAAGMASFAFIVAASVLFLVLFFAEPDLFDTAEKQTLWCLFPPMAIQMGLLSKFNCHCGLFAFVKSQISIGTVLGMMILDSFMFCFAAWYLGQIMPSDVGIARPPWFILMPSYWLGVEEPEPDGDGGTVNPISAEGGDGEQPTHPMEVADPAVVGDATVSVKGLKKTFGNFRAVKGLTFDMYEGQIFSLLGHNGAGKTTTINMLTGLFAPDASSGKTSIYSMDIKTKMPEARKSIGICPQHDVLFKNLTTREHIIFYALLKGGASSWRQAAQEAEGLIEHFHLTERSNHVGAELSGGMKRKVSTAVALCGNSRFVILDEPTAGMDALARRELWDLLKGMRKGRTMLLTTHYMDEADVLGDRIGIMSRGELQCLGSSSFLKHNFGSGYKLICTIEYGALVLNQESSRQNQVGSTNSKMQVESSSSRIETESVDMRERGLTSDASPTAGDGASGPGRRLENHKLVKRILEYIQGFVQDASFAKSESSAATLVFVLPFSAVKNFKNFFANFEAELRGFQIVGFGVSITSLEEVFLKVGGDHDLEEFATTSADEEQTSRSLSGAHGEPSLLNQVYGLWWKRISTSLVDWKRTAPLLLFPVACVVTGWALNYEGKIQPAGEIYANLVGCIIAACGYLPVVSLICEAVVDERTRKLRSVLTVMGCDAKAYWLGTFAGDFTLVMTANLASFIIILIFSQLGDPGDDWKDDEPLLPYVVGAKALWILIFSAVQLCGFSYILSFMFNSSGSAIVFSLCLSLALVFLPFQLPGIVYFGLRASGLIGGYFGFFNNAMRIMAVVSPHVALTQGLMISSGVCEGIAKYDGFYTSCVLMPYWAYLLIMIGEGALYVYLAYLIDLKNVTPLQEQAFVMNDTTVQQLDDDVRQEREHVQATAPREFALRISNLRKLFPAKTARQPPLQAVKSLNLGIARGEIFGLLGANGAGKTTAISMIMRSLQPTAGNVHIEGKSVLSDFQVAAKHLGVVAQVS